MTREQWFNKAITYLRPLFKRIEVELPDNVRVSCGWPSKFACGKNRRVGECWKKDCSGDDHFEVFISPTECASLDALAILVHELVHIAVYPEMGHKKPFKDVAVQIGLEGKMTATRAGKILLERLDVIVKQIGEYPHGGIKIPVDDTKKQGTRMLKVECPCCGYTLRTTRKWIMVGLPICCCGEGMIHEELE
jgi:hypothetical protein